MSFWCIIRVISDSRRGGGLPVEQRRDRICCWTCSTIIVLIFLRWNQTLKPESTLVLEENELLFIFGFWLLVIFVLKTLRFEKWASMVHFVKQRETLKHFLWEAGKWLHAIILLPSFYILIMFGGKSVQRRHVGNLSGAGVRDLPDFFTAHQLYRGF